MRTILLFFIFLKCFFLNAQNLPEWVSSYGGNPSLYYEAIDMKLDNFGNTYVLGIETDQSSSFYLYTLVLIKYNSLGIQQWVKTYSCADGYGIIQLDKNFNVYVITKTLYMGTSDFLILKHDNNGNLKWLKQYDGSNHMDDIPTSIVIDDYFNVYVSGTTNSFFGSNNEGVIIKYDSIGTELWYSNTGGGSRIAIDAFNGIYSISRDSFSFYNLTKYNMHTGVLIWNRALLNAKEALFLFISADNYAYIGGVYMASPTCACSDFLCIKYDSVGNEIWNKTYDAQSSLPFNAWDKPRDMKIDSVGNAYLTGTQFFGNGSNNDYCTVKFDKYGNIMWAKSYSDTEYGDATSISIDNIGNVYVTGTATGTPYDGITTIKYDSLGNLVWFTVYYTTLSEGGGYPFINADGADGIYLSCSIISINNPRFITLKYNLITEMAELPYTIYSFDIYPNPATSTITVESKIKEVQSIKMVDVLGREIYYLPIQNNKIEIDVSHLPSGIYILQLQSKNGVVSKKFVKE